jgi:hypothetical protein
MKILYFKEGGQMHGGNKSFGRKILSEDISLEM